jgi:hypothetical protein
MKVGVLYAKSSQCHAKDWLANKKGAEILVYSCNSADAVSDKFWVFMNYLGKEEDMANWDKYSGSV